MAKYGQTKNQLGSNPSQHNVDLAPRDKETNRLSNKRIGKYELYEDSIGQWRFRLKAANGEVIAVSEGYTTKEGAKNGIKSVRKNAQSTRVDVV